MSKSTKKRKTPPKHHEIAEYWMNNWKEYTFTPAIDIGEPSCFGCGIFDNGWDYNPDSKKRDTWQKCWESTKGKLERAHIIPHSLDGSNDVSNYVLLCKKCHSSAPNVKDREYFLSWVKKVTRMNLDKQHTIIELTLDRFPKVKALFATDFNYPRDIENFWDRMIEAKASETSYHFDSAGIGTDTTADFTWATISFINDLIESGEIEVIENE